MDYKIAKDIRITLTLSSEELNTLVGGFGGTDHEGRVFVANRHGLKIVDWRDSDGFYTKLKQIAIEASKDSSSK